MGELQIGGDDAHGMTMELGMFTGGDKTLEHVE